eukprot:2929983-Pyramimonas_sp.AAC.1
MSRPQRSLRDLHHARSMIADIGFSEAPRTINDTRFSRKLCHNPPRPTAPEPIQYGDGVSVAIVVCWLARKGFHRGLQRRGPMCGSGALSFTLGESAARLARKERSTWSKIEAPMKNGNMAKRIQMSRLQVSNQIFRHSIELGNGQVVFVHIVIVNVGAVQLKGYS